MADHYFSRKPGVAARLREIEVEIGGRSFAMRTSSGVFSADGLDHATRHLLDRLDVDDTTPARVLDLGCGWGPVALALATRWPQAEVWAVDVNERALELTARNAERHDLPVTTSLPEDVPDALTFDAIWSNPPIRIGKQALHDLLLHWLDRLTAEGTMTMVVGRQLGADSLQRWLVEQGWPTERIGSAKGFRLLRARRP
ncbi:MAG: methyltransferase [Aeromicrobium sp.]|uniref:class I SAM-dependent methyltransferase n=1 Tax=Aeromicrobium sp. TaxID=1871063 RepID=UPI0025BB97DD|nr:methyltransferase [Aeromicrobium sp.]MDF1704545.1 methyltransferase [Aeromicrobium sp.]